MFQPINNDDADESQLEESTEDPRRLLTPVTFPKDMEYNQRNDPYRTPEHSFTQPENCLPFSYPSDSPSPRSFSNPIIMSPEFILTAHPIPERDTIASLKNPFYNALFGEDNNETPASKVLKNTLGIEDRIVTVNCGRLRGAVGKGAATLTRFMYIHCIIISYKTFFEQSKQL